MAVSSLATWKWNGKTNHWNKRDHIIDRITIHMMAGNGSLKTCCDWLAYHSGGSVNYCIDSTGTIGWMIDESLRAWTSSSRPNDMRAVTIEVANDGGSPNWHVSDKALASVIRLCADICKRNGIKALEYTGDRTCRTGNMSLHKWFAATSCPGPYLEGKMTYIASEVNKILNASAKKSIDEIAKEVIQGKWGAGADRKKRLTAAGYDYNTVQARVNELMKPKKKSLDEIAKEVIQGKWGAGNERARKLTTAGYDYTAVQKRVNEMLKNGGK